MIMKNNVSLYYKVFILFVKKDGKMSIVKKKAVWEKVRSFTIDIKQSKEIYSVKEFKEVLKYERIRADRNNSTFSVILFSASDIYKTKRRLDLFIKKVKKQVRSIDHVGWYDSNHIAVLLPDTIHAGAEVLGDKIIYGFDFVDDPEKAYKIYTYPDNWLDKCARTTTQVKMDSGKVRPDFYGCVENSFTVKMPLFKRSMDIFLSSLGLLIAAPVFIIVPIFIKIVSPGPVFFHQPRVGFKKEEFCFWKFRTMHVDNNQTFHGKHSQSFIKAGDIPMEKLDDHDPRIIPGGKFLRKSCIDELPQLWNVLKGDMSLVGPRPCIPYEAEEYLRWHTHRFDIVPGLTGLWQVSGKNKLTFKQMIRLDIAYSNSISAWTDIKIIMKTPYVIVKMMSEAAAKKIQKGCLEEMDAPELKLSETHEVSV